MHEELGALLFARHPKIFPIEASSRRILFRFECGDGWFPLIDASCELITRCDIASQTEPLIALQVKEKFGGLRFYHRGGGEGATTVVKLIQSLSHCICEICAAPGRCVVLNRWMRTRCILHEHTTCDEILIQHDVRQAVVRIPPLADVLSASAALFAQDVEETVRWLTHPVLGLGNVPPIHLLMSAEGQQQLLGLIGSLEFGVLS